ncbi:flagellin [Arthrobacter gengyunqii]|uniref:Flagellin n=1 Tax=Arthrobacter gengyunqii TaxID=2886940 RepID=A0A9X1S7N4_9MICC|nr:flagellin [Arthrobacter gengyunqii]MCC3270943.1 flagellin [Arthrobacter gengyunqii]UOY96565.1 flagellin [Arthrobacter gengyunqii]
MGFTINTNTASNNAYRNLTLNQNAQSKSLEKLSSGLRINRAADDAAGLAISEGLKNQVSGMTVAARNAQDGISVIQTAEGALTEVHSILNRVRDLAVQSGNDSNNEDSRAAITTEVKELAKELTRIGTSTNFNGIDLLKSTDATGATSVPKTLTFQIGAGGAKDNDQIDVKMVDVAAIGAALTTLATGTPAVVDADGNVTTPAVNGFTSAAKALTTIESLDKDIKTISSARSELGASQNRLESTIKSLNVSIENLSSAGSRIRDTDMASEMANFTRSQILSQAGTAMLSQANQMNSGVMQLLQ